MDIIIPKNLIEMIKPEPHEYLIMQIIPIRFTPWRMISVEEAMPRVMPPEMLGADLDVAL